MLSKEQIELIHKTRFFSEWFNVWYFFHSAFVRTIENITGEKENDKNTILGVAEEVALKYCEIFRKEDKEPCEFHGDIEELRNFFG